MDQPSSNKSRVNPYLISLAILLVLMSVVSFGLTLYSLFTLEAKPLADFTAILESDKIDPNSYHRSELIGLSILDHFLALFMKPLIIAAIALVLLVFGLILCILSRPTVRVQRPIYFEKSSSRAKESDDYGARVIEVPRDGLRNLLSYLSPFQWLLIALAVVFFIGYMRVLMGITLGVLAISLWNRFGGGSRITIRPNPAEDESENDIESGDEEELSADEPDEDSQDSKD